MHSLCLCAFVVLFISVGPTVRIASVHRFAASLLPAGSPTPVQINSDLQKAVNRALPMLQRSAKEFVAKRACVSCHHNILSVLALHQAAERGFTIDSSVLNAVEEKTFPSLRGPNALDDAIQAATVNDPTPNDSFLLMAAHAAGIKPGLVTSVYARRLLGWQRDGHWVTSDFRPPHSSSLFTATATAVRAIRLYMPEASVERARAWLLQNRPVSAEDAAFRLMGLAWAGGSSGEIASAARDLFTLQKSNGGWAQLPDYEPDAYSTGEALFALREAGLDASDAALRRGLRFLISTQAADGTWRVRTRMISPAEVSPKYFTTGFPYEKDEYLSYAGSCWAVMALVGALPQSKTVAPGQASGLAPESWLQTALSGSVNELRALLDGGLDPNAKTEKGTTLLMAAVLDPDKVRLLIARGANVKVRGASGPSSPSSTDALTIAAAYRGTAASIQLLLDAGAEPDPPKEVRVRNAPLTLASMTGDLDNVKLLLARGAHASESALSQAATFGYADVVRTLIAAGANTDIVDHNGINLLHWAAITDRPSVIPALVEAHVPIDATDDYGFTPLMYAATIDFGDTAVLSALLKAGADRTIRNDDQRTPLEQARHFKHARMEALLK
jgi:ankyrin repeat protein